MKTWKIIVLAIAVAGLIAALYVWFFVYNKPHRDYIVAEPDMELTAEQLYFDFIEDEQLAHETYNGKVLEIQGELTNVEQVEDMVILNFVIDEGMFGGEGVRFTMFEPFHQEALSLEAGTMLTVKGFCTGFTGSDVILEHASFP